MKRYALFALGFAALAALTIYWSYPDADRRAEPVTPHVADRGDGSPATPFEHEAVREDAGRAGGRLEARLFRRETFPWGSQEGRPYERVPAGIGVKGGLELDLDARLLDHAEFALLLTQEGHAPGLRCFTGEQFRNASDRSSLLGPVTLEPGWIVRGKVVDATDGPVPDARISLVVDGYRYILGGERL